MNDGLARQMVFGTYPDGFTDSVFAVGKGFSRLMNVGQYKGGWLNSASRCSTALSGQTNPVYCASNLVSWFQFYSARSTELQCVQGYNIGGILCMTTFSNPRGMSTYIHLL